MFSLLPVFVLLSYNTKGQDIFEFAKKLQNAYPSNSKVERILDKYSAQKVNFRIDRLSERINFFETLESEYLINQYKNNDNQDSLKGRWRLFKIATGSKLIYLHLEKTHENGSWVFYRPLIDIVDTNAIRDQMSLFTKIGTMKMGIEQLITGTDYDIYGVSWGLRGPEELDDFQPMEEIYREVAEKDTTNLLKRCRSKCNETKAYGATGLFLLQKEGLILDSNTRKLIEGILRSEEKITFAPGGCIVYSGMQINKSLTPDYLEEVYESYKGYKSETRKKNNLKIVEQ